MNRFAVRHADMRRGCRRRSEKSYLSAFDPSLVLGIRKPSLKYSTPTRLCSRLEVRTHGTFRCVDSLGNVFNSWSWGTVGRTWSTWSTSVKESGVSNESIIVCCKMMPAQKNHQNRGLANFCDILGTIWVPHVPPSSGFAQ